MITRLEKFILSCDRCSAFITIDEGSRITKKKAREVGWKVCWMDDLCPRCHKKARENKNIKKGETNYV